MSLDHLSETHNSFWFAEACRRARKGIDLLDERGPAGWRERLHPLSLDMGSGIRDVLGQLYGSFHRGMCALFGDEWADREPMTDPQTDLHISAFGFMPFLEVSKFMLTDAWRKELWTPHS
jgi:hypothetical protein